MNLNAYRFVLYHVEKKKELQIDAIIQPKLTTEAHSQDPGRRGETSFQRTILVTTYESIRMDDLQKNTLTNQSPIGRYLLNHEHHLCVGDTFTLKIGKTRNTYKVLHKESSIKYDRYALV